MLSMFVNENTDDWDDQLPYVMAAYRATEHKSTGCSPNLLMLNRETTCPLDLMVGHPPGQDPPECPILYVEWVRQSMTGAYGFVYDNLGQAALRQSQDYNNNKKLKLRKFTSGSWVWRWYPPKANQKLGLGWVGPYLVMEEITPWVYKIQKQENARPINVHVDHLKPLEGEDHPTDWRLDEDEELPPVNEPENTDSGQIVNTESPLAATQGPSDQLDTDLTLAHDQLAVPFVPKSRRGRPIKPREIYSPS